MKKRVKLLTTIASLCLAVALMAFGVYAATSIKLNVNSTITFISSEVQGTWAYSVVAESADVATITDGTGSEISGAKQGETNDYEHTVSPKIALGTGAGTITYKLTYTNTGSKSAKVTFTFNKATDFTVGGKASGIVYTSATVESGVASGEIKTNGTCEITVVLTYTYANMDESVRISGIDGIAFNISGEAVPFSA